MSVWLPVYLSVTPNLVKTASNDKIFSISEVFLYFLQKTSHGDKAWKIIPNWNFSSAEMARWFAQSSFQKKITKPFTSDPSSFRFLTCLFFLLFKQFSSIFRFILTSLIGLFSLKNAGINLIIVRLEIHHLHRC